MKVLPILLSDSYKQWHYKFYPEGMTKLFSNMTPRSFKHLGTDKAVFFGLQYYLKEYLIEQWNHNFFDQDLELVLTEYKRFHKNFSFADIDTDHIEKLHKLGYLPLEIKALPEGSKVNSKVPFYTIVNTHSDHAWLVNFLETQMSTVIWDLCVIATIGYQYRTLLDKWAIKTTGSTEGVQWQGHDFSMRGRSSVESTFNQAGWLLSFNGTDTIPAVLMLEEYYGANIEKELVGSSVPASEHSCMTAYGKENEIDAFKRILKQFPTGIVSIVSDSFDLWKVCTEFVTELKEEIINRDGKIVIRPDCYSDDTSVLTNSGWKLFKDLDEEDLVAQVIEDGTYEFIKPIKYVNEFYKGDMIHYYDHNGKIDLLVTPNHRMIFDTGTKNFSVQEAKDCNFFWNKNIRRSAKAPNYMKELSPIEALKIAFQADGSFTTSGNKIRFSFSKQRKIERMESILNDCQIEYKIYDLNDGRVEFNINVDSSLFSKNLDWVNTSDLCSNWCKEFIEELSYWDATRRHSDRFKFDTTNKKVIDIVEYIAMSAGYGILISHRHDNRKDIFSDVYTGHILKNNLLGGQSIQKEVVPYEGNVVCVQVPTGILVVKRGKGQVVCGNSGDPVNIICGNFINTTDGNDNYSLEPEYTDHPSSKGVIELLWDVFGGTINEQGYKVLDPHIGAIYGDSIDLKRANEICNRLEQKGFASTNIVFGVGSYTMNYNTRDSLGIAVKSTYCEVFTENGLEQREIFKDPITDDGIKKSAKGLLVVHKNDSGEYILKDQVSWGEVNSDTNELKTVFLNGKLFNEQKFSEIKQVLNK